MLRKNRLTITLIGVIALLSAEARAEVNYGQRLSLPSGFSKCDERCHSQALALKATYLAQQYRRDPACKRFARHYTGDSTGAALGKAARQECAEAKARQELGLAPGTNTAQAEYRKHFDREGARREGISDRAMYRSEQAQNRNAANWNTYAPAAPSTATATR